MSLLTPDLPRIAIVLKGYPRLSETFIAQELLALERRGLPLVLWSLRQPTDVGRHPMHDEIRAPLNYLPEYLYQAPGSVLAALAWAIRLPGFARLLASFWRDLRRDPSASRLRRLGQALVLARALPVAITHLHAHFLHSPSSVARYAAILTGRSWSFSAHAKDIWTTPDWDLSDKLAEAAWGVTCTRDGHTQLNSLNGSDRTTLAYHGLDLERFPRPPARRANRDGSDPAAPIELLCVGRLVAKKGHDDLLDALAGLPSELHWRLTLIGGGDLRASLSVRATKLGLTERIRFLGALAQPAVIAAMREADLFVLPTKLGSNGDRDGLPNVLMEAASQQLPILATDFGGTPEFIVDGREGILVPPGNPVALSAALLGLAKEPALRQRLGRAAHRRLQTEFSIETGIALIAGRLAASAGLAVASADDLQITGPRAPACAC